MKVRGISWIGVGTDRYAETLRFFVDVMGLEVAAADEEQALLRVADASCWRFSAATGEASR